jgi:hypothetical protein
VPPAILSFTFICWWYRRGWNGPCFIYGSVFVKAHKKERITYIAAYLRPGKEMPFDKIGQLEKAPVLTGRVVAWDVVRPNRSLIRVVARGSERKANSITIFIVKRPRTD